MRKQYIGLVSVLVLLAVCSALLWVANNGSATWVYAQAQSTSAATAAAAQSTVASQVPDVPQYVPDGYDSQAQYDQWWQSACGPATLTALLKAYGVKTRIGTVLDLIWETGGIDQSGLHGPHAFVAAIQQYYSSFQVVPFGQDEAGLSYARLARIVNAGIPVAVDLWDEYGTYFPLQPGHWLVVVKITGDHVIGRDSSTLHLDNKITVAVFQKIYTTVAAVLLPKGQQVPA